MPRRPSVLILVLAVAAGGILLAQESAPSRPEPDTTPPADQAPRPMQTIVLDPGHGGEEVGAVGRSGVYEKDLALDIAKRLRDRLKENLKMNVLLTREEDRIVPLRERTAAANHAKADLFISIHMNSSRRASAHGTETYFLALTASDEESLSLAQAENLATGEPAAPPPANGESAASSAPPDERGTTVNNDLELVLWGMAQSEHLVRSSRLAEVIQDEMNRLLGVPSRGIKQAPFTVLMGATMPAVLVEVAFLSNETEERDLNATEFRDKVAAALESAIVRFKNESERTPTEGPPAAPPASER